MPTRGPSGRLWIRARTKAALGYRGPIFSGIWRYDIYPIMGTIPASAAQLTEEEKRELLIEILEA